MPNTFALIMLFGWPVIAFVIYRTLPFERALIWSFMAAYMILPEATGIDPPLIPALDKTSITNISAFVICILILGKKLQILPASGWAKVLILCYLVSPFATVLTNSDPLTLVSGLTFPGLKLYDSVSMIIQQMIYMMPFLLARQLLISPGAQRELMIAFVIGGLIYSLPILLEIRLSPRMHIWVYGFLQHDFLQMLRGSGYRPIVFMHHGIWLTLWVMMCVISAAILAMVEPKERKAFYMLSMIYLAGVLALSKSLGAMVYLVFLLPMVLLTTGRLQLRIAVVLALLVMTYPLLRGMGLIPVEGLLDIAGRLSEDRMLSLQFRFDNEDMLLAHAQDKPLFGWGGFGRNEVYDAETGRNISVIDGRWLAVFGLLGWGGYIAEFGLLILPVVLVWRQSRRKMAALSPYVPGLCLIHGVNLLDLLPNATLVPLTWLLAGMLLGYAESLAKETAEGTAGDAEAAKMLLSDAEQDPAPPPTKPERKKRQRRGFPHRPELEPDPTVGKARHYRKKRYSK